MHEFPSDTRRSSEPTEVRAFEVFKAVIQGFAKADLHCDANLL